MKIHICDDQGTLLQSVTDYSDEELINRSAHRHADIYDIITETTEAIRAEIHSMRKRAEIKKE